MLYGRGFWFFKIRILEFWSEISPKKDQRKKNAQKYTAFFDKSYILVRLTKQFDRLNFELFELILIWFDIFFPRATSFQRFTDVWEKRSNFVGQRNCIGEWIQFGLISRAFHLFNNQVHYACDSICSHIERSHNS